MKVERSYLTQRAQRAQKNVDSLTLMVEGRISLTVDAGAGEVAVDTRRRAQRFTERKTEIGKRKTCNLKPNLL